MHETKLLFSAVGQANGELYWWWTGQVDRADPKCWDRSCECKGGRCELNSSYNWTHSHCSHSIDSDSSGISNIVYGICWCTVSLQGERELCSVSWSSLTPHHHWAGAYATTRTWVGRGLGTEVFVLLSPQLLEAMAGKSNIVECAFVKSDVSEAPYFATPLLLGKNGVEQNFGMGELSDFEKKKLQEVCAWSWNH